MIKSAYRSRFLASMAVAVALALPAGSTFAAASNGDYVGKTAAEIAATLKQQGYKVREIEREGGYLEAEVVLDGRPYQIYTDRRTGQIVEIIEGGEDDGDEKAGSLIKRLLRIGDDDD